MELHQIFLQAFTDCEYFHFPFSIFHFLFPLQIVFDESDHFPDLAVAELAFEGNHSVAAVVDLVVDLLLGFLFDVAAS